MTSRAIIRLAGAGLSLAAIAATGSSVAVYGSSGGSGGPSLRLQAFDSGTGERFVLTLTWESWPSRSDPVRRCQQAALYLGGEIARRMTVESVGCAE